MMELNFLSKKKNLRKWATFSIYVSDQKFKKSMDFLLVTDGDKSHYVYTKEFDRFMFHKKKNKNKNYFCIKNKNVLTKHKEVCLSFNGTQSIKF